MADCFPYAIYLFFAIVFIISFVVMREFKHLELLGLSIFLFINLLFSFYLGKSLFGFLTDINTTNEVLLNVVILIITIAFNIVSSVATIFSMTKLRSAFGKRNIKLAKTDRKHVDDTQIIFISLVCFIGAACLNVFFQPNELFQTMFETLRTITTHPMSIWIKILFPVILAGIGGRLYDNMDNRCKNPEIEDFKSNFKTTYWLLFGLVMLFLFRILIDVLFYRKNIRTLVNPFQFSFMPNLFGFDMFLDLAKWGLMISALVFSGFSIRDYHSLNKSNHCVKKYITGLFIAFITMLMILFAITLVTPYQLTSIFTFIVRFLIPPTLLGLSAYLVYLTNDLAKMASKHVIK